MPKLKEVLEMTIEELRARRRSCVSFRDVCAKDTYREDERLDVCEDIQEINKRIEELNG